MSVNDAILRRLVREGDRLSAREATEIRRLLRRKITGPNVQETSDGWHIRAPESALPTVMLVAKEAMSVDDTEYEAAYLSADGTEGKYIIVRRTNGIGVAAGDVGFLGEDSEGRFVFIPIAASVGEAHNLLSSTHEDTDPSSPPTRASIIVADSASKWAEAQPSSSGQYVRYDGTDTYFDDIDPDDLPAHPHDGETMEFDAINSNGGAFAFTTTGPVTFSQNLVMPSGGYIGAAGDTNLLQLSASLLYVRGAIKIGDGQYIGVETTPQAIQIAYTGAVTMSAGLTVRGGQVDIGQAGTMRGVVVLRGAPTGSALGGRVIMYTADDYDSIIDAYTIRANEDDLLIGPNTDDNILRIIGNNTASLIELRFDRKFTAASMEADNGYDGTIDTASSVTITVVGGVITGVA